MQKQKSEKKFKSLSIKIVGNITILIVFVFLLVGFLILKTAKKTIRELSETELTVKSQSASSQISEFFTKYLSQIEHIALNRTYETALLQTTNKIGIDDLPEYLIIKEELAKSASTDTNNILGVWIAGFEASQVIQSNGFLSEKGWDVTQRPWYEVKNTKKPMLTIPYEDVTTKSLVITIVAPILNQTTGEPIGAAGIDITLADVEQVMSTYRLGKSGNFLLADSEGTIIYYPDTNFINKKITEVGFSDNIINNILHNSSQFTQYTLNGISNYGYVSEVGQTNWTVTSMLPKSEFNSIFDKISIIVISIFLTGICFIIIIIQFIASSIIKPLKNLTNTSKEIAEGNLNVDVFVNSEDEIGTLGITITNMVIRLKEYIKYIDEISNVLEQIGNGNLKFQLQCDYTGEFSKLKVSLLHVQEKWNKALKNINSVSKQVADGAIQVAQVATSLANASTEQKKSVENLETFMQSMEQLAEKNEINAMSANNNAQIASQHLQNGYEKFGKLIQTIQQISESSNQINGIIEIMNDIASQTNLLSFNASIEAARAGELGKGFAVVANEVGNLANQSTNSAGETAILIASILVAIECGSQIAGDASKTMLMVMENAKNSSIGISTILQSVEEETTAMKQLKNEIHQITLAVQANMISSQKSVAASEELASQAAALKDLVNVFTIL